MAHRMVMPNKEEYHYSIAKNAIIWKINHAVSIYQCTYIYKDVPFNASFYVHNFVLRSFKGIY